MIYGRPVIQVLKSLDVFLERLLAGTAPPLNEKDWRAKKLKEFIDQHQGNARLRLGDVSKQVGLPMSDRQARRLFKVSIGVGIREYSRNRRLAVAVQRLEATDVPVKAIAADLGYQSTREFRRLFKEFFGLSPMEFRRVWWSRSLRAN